MARKDLTAISRILSHALRHEPWLYDLELDAEGWTPVEAMLAALRAERDDWRDVTADDLAEVIATSTKRRHEMVGGRIRALYGHSVPDKLARVAPPPPERLDHGNSPDALEVERRKHPQPVLLLVNAAEAATAGVPFYVGNDKVWLADRMPWQFIANDA
jgi:putative RNA 2'-phosphotransferase